MFNFEIHELSITNTKFNYLSASPVDRAYIFDFSFSGTDYQVPDFKMYSSNFEDIECYNCDSAYPLMSFNHNNFLISGSSGAETIF